MSSNQDTPQAKFYTYAHFRADDGKCFYIGKGKSKRAWSTRRSQFWKNVANKHGYRVQILATWEGEEDAFEHERMLIACFRDLGHPLVNLTDGGEGSSGAVRSAETRAKMAERARQRMASPEARQAMAEKARQQMSSPEARQAQAERARQQWSSPEARQALAEKARQRMASPEARASMSGESNPSAKLSDDACRVIFHLRAPGMTLAKIADRIGCTRAQVSNILSGKQRRNIYLEFHPEEQ